jgi:hypothetical protein
LGRTSFVLCVRRDGFRGLCSLMSVFRGLDRTPINTSRLHSGSDAPNEWRNKIEFARDCLVPFPRRQVGKSEPLDFLRKMDSFRTSTWSIFTHANFLARFSLERKVFRYPRDNKKRNLLLLDFHLDNPLRVYLAIEIVTRFFCNLEEML